MGSEGVRKLIAGIPKDSDIPLKLPKTATQVIDSWLESNLSDPPDKLERALDLIADAGSGASSQAEIARYLLANATRRGFFLDSWEKPEHTDAWYSSRRADPTTKHLIERFIREVLPWSHSYYAESFAQDLGRLAPDLSQAFLDAALAIVHLGVTHNDDPIAEGALEDLAGYENIVNEAVIAREVTPQEKEKADELHLRLVNGEYSEEYAEHLATSDEDGYTAGEFLKAYVRRLHKTGNWKQIAAHAHSDSMSWYWLTVFRDDLNPSKFFDEEASTPTPEIKIDREELTALFELAFNSRHEDDLWHLVGLVWDGRFLPPLLERMKQRSDLEKVRVAALRCLLLFAPNEFKSICDDLRKDDRTNRLVEIAFDLAYLGKHLSGLSKRNKEPEPEIAAAMQQLPPAAIELGLAFTESLHDRKPATGEQAHHLLISIYNPSEDMRRLRLSLGKASDATWQEDVDALLISATEDEIAAEAVQAAAREIQAAVLEQALMHKFARVRGSALRAIADGLAAPLPARLLEMASDKGQYVRRTLGELLAKKVHPSHLATLIKLARDNYSTGNHYSDDQAQFPIARAAVKAMTGYPPLSAQTVDELSEIAISSGDVTLRSNIFDTLATHAGPDGQQMLFQLATEPGRYLIRGQAAAALLSALGSADSTLVEKITPELLNSQSSNVVASLALLLGAEGELRAIERAANALAANSKRRVLVLLLIHAVNGRSPEWAPKLAALLPSDHPALEWASGGDIDWEDDKPLSDLGERSICKEVFVFMQPSRQKPGPDLVG